MVWLVDAYCRTECQYPQLHQNPSRTRSPTYSYLPTGFGDSDAPSPPEWDELPTRSILSYFIKQLWEYICQRKAATARVITTVRNYGVTISQQEGCQRSKSLQIHHLLLERLCMFVLTFIVSGKYYVELHIQKSVWNRVQIDHSRAHKRNWKYINYKWLKKNIKKIANQKNNTCYFFYVPLPEIHSSLWPRPHRYIFFNKPKLFYGVLFWPVRILTSLAAWLWFISVRNLNLRPTRLGELLPGWKCLNQCYKFHFAW